MEFLYNPCTMITPEQAKHRSHLFLKNHGLPINQHLPLLERISELRPQGAKAVAQRCIILNYVIGIAYYAKPRKLHEFLIETGLIEHASAKERALLAKPNHTEEEKADATWLAESVQSLAWCMCLVELDPFRGCDHNLASRFPKPFVDHSEFVNSATIRSFDDIYEQADLHYRLHWVVRNARLKGSECGVNEWIIRKRRKSLDWMIGIEPDWDQIPLDT